MDHAYTFVVPAENVLADGPRARHSPRLLRPVTATLGTITGFVVAFSGLIGGSSGELALGAFLMIVCGLVPIARYVHTRDEREATLQVAVDACGLRAEATGGVIATYPWSKLTRVHVTRGGVLLEFGARASYLLPRHGFASRGEMDAFGRDMAARRIGDAGAG